MVVTRHARKSDVPGILHCLHTAFEPFRQDYSEAAFRDTVLDSSSLRSRMTQMSVFVAELDNGIVGTVAAAIDSDEGHLRGMAVLPSCEHAGVGRRLVRRALDELTVTGCRRAALGTTAVLLRAAKFYESAGFTRTGRVSDFFGSGGIDIRVVNLRTELPPFYAARGFVPAGTEPVFHDPRLFRQAHFILMTLGF